MTHQSPYAISYTPAGGSAIVLVPVGGWLAAAPVLEATQRLYESDGIQAENAFFRPLGGVVVTLTFTVEIDMADLLSALDTFLHSLQVIELLTGGTLSLTPASGLVITFTDAVFSSVTPDLPSGFTSATTRAYTVRASIPTLS